MRFLVKWVSDLNGNSCDPTDPPPEEASPRNNECPSTRRGEGLPSGAAGAGTLGQAPRESVLASFLYADWKGMGAGLGSGPPPQFLA